MHINAKIMRYYFFFKAYIYNFHNLSEYLTNKSVFRSVVSIVFFYFLFLFSFDCCNNNKKSENLQLAQELWLESY